MIRRRMMDVLMVFGLVLGASSSLHAAPKKGGPVPDKATSEKIVLAGGCFWGMQDILRKLPGVTRSTVGYAGGKTENPVYEQVKTGTTGHAESIELEYTATAAKLDEILDLFFKMHDPTTVNRQGNDVGSQYRSAIFYATEAQRAAAEAAKKRAQDSGRWKKPVVTEIVPATKFYPAESYHQDYLVKNPGGYTCHYIRK